MRRAVVVFVAVLAVAGPLGVATAPAVADGGSPDVEPRAVDRPAGTTLDRPDPKTVIRINVTQTGDARVAVESRFLVNESDDNQTAAFESTYEDARDGTIDLPYDEETMRALVEDVAASTGREMAVEDVEWTRSVSNGTGTIALRFGWTNFGIDRQETVVVGDAFRTADGAWLPRLADGQRLVLRAPDGYSALSPSDQVGERRIVWNGVHEFEAGAPSATFGQQESTTVTTATPTTGPGPTTRTATPTTNGTGSGGDGASLLVWAVVLLTILSVGGGGYWYVTERGGDGGTPTAATDGATTVEAAESSGADADGAGSGTAAAAGAAAGETADDGAADDEDGAAAVDPELLSDEERVEHLLESNGGRMKQAQIVKETGWSNAKVSQLLSAMDEEDRIDKLRIGRENLITLPDEDVTDF